jgi:hypothetical protein
MVHYVVQVLKQAPQNELCALIFEVLCPENKCWSCLEKFCHCAGFNVLTIVVMKVFYLLKYEYNVMYFHKNQPLFLTNISPPSLVLKKKPSKKLAWSTYQIVFLFTLLYNPDDGGDILLRKVGLLSPAYTVRYSMFISASISHSPSTVSALLVSSSKARVSSDSGTVIQRP